MGGDSLVIVAASFMVILLPLQLLDDLLNPGGIGLNAGDDSQLGPGIDPERTDPSRFT